MLSLNDEPIIHIACKHSTVMSLFKAVLMHIMLVHHECVCTYVHLYNTRAHAYTYICMYIHIYIYTFICIYVLCVHHEYAIIFMYIHV